MKFLLIISHDDQFSPDEALFQDIAAWIEEAERKGIRLHGQPLRPACDATTVRIRDGVTQVADGPFSDAREQMCAFELIECKDKPAAVQVAASHPMARLATIEVRPVWNELAHA